MMMPNDKTYIQARQIMLGKENIKPEFAPLAQWIDQTYGVKTVDIFYELPDSGKPRIQVCLELEEDMEKFLTHSISYFDTSKQEAIAQKFKAVIEQQGLSEKTGFFSGLWGKPKSNTYSTDHVFVTYSAFEPAAKYEAASKISRQQIEEFMASLHHKDLWTISIEFFVPVFFVFTYSQAEEYNRSETKSIWEEEFFNFIQPFDEFGYFTKENTRIIIDSKENFDDNYSSNWYYYYK